MLPTRKEVVENVARGALELAYDAGVKKGLQQAKLEQEISAGSWFPLLIEYTETKESVVVYTPTEIRWGTTFKVLETRHLK